MLSFCRHQVVEENLVVAAAISCVGAMELSCSDAEAEMMSR